MADGKKIRYININDKIMDKDGKLIPGMLNTDNLHPDTKAIRPGPTPSNRSSPQNPRPPAKEDHAPPPTGDPKTNPVYPPVARPLPPPAKPTDPLGAGFLE